VCKKFYVHQIAAFSHFAFFCGDGLAQTPIQYGGAIPPHTPSLVTYASIPPPKLNSAFAPE